MRAGTGLPAEWNALCEPKGMWFNYPSTKALTSAVDRVSCKTCVALIAAGFTEVSPEDKAAASAQVLLRGLEPDVRRMYGRVADLLGPAGAPALLELAQALLDAGYDEGRGM
jgi:hypothetical protein